MSRQRRKNGAGDSPVSWLEWYNAIDWAKFTPLFWTAVLGGNLACAVWGLEILKARIFAQPEYNPAIKIVLHDAPGWIEEEGWRPHILSAVKVPSSANMMDGELLRTVAEQMASSGWVSQIKAVTRDTDGTVRIDCDYRRPIAMLEIPVENGQDRGTRRYVAVDREGVRLPQIYDNIDDGSGWMKIQGARATLPEVGRPFVEKDAVAAIRLASKIFDQPEIAPRIVGVDVSNYGGRLKRNEDHIYLRTRDGGRIVWGSAIGEEIEEPSVQDKLRSILAYFRQAGSQTQVNHVNVSVYQTGWIEPLSPALRTANEALVLK